MDKENSDLDFLLRTPQDVMLECARRVRTMRIEQNLSQVALGVLLSVAP